MIEFRAHSPRELKSERKVVAGVFKSISRRNVFQERFTWRAVVVGLFLAQFLQYGRNNLTNDNRVRPFYYTKTMTREGQGV